MADSFSLRIHEAQPEATYTYVIGPAGSTRSTHYPGGREVVETRDLRSRLEIVSSALNRVQAAWAFDAAARRSAAALGLRDSHLV